MVFIYMVFIVLYMHASMQYIPGIDKNKLHDSGIYEKIGRDLRSIPLPSRPCTIVVNCTDLLQVLVASV